MGIPGAQEQTVLDGQGGNPDIIGRNRRPLGTELPIQAGVLMGSAFIGVQNMHERLCRQERSSP